MGGMFGSSPPPVERTPDPPSREDPAVEEARRREIQTARSARGRAQTLLTGGLGVSAGSTATRRTSLLGVN